MAAEAAGVHAAIFDGVASPTHSITDSVSIMADGTDMSVSVANSSFTRTGGEGGGDGKHHHHDDEEERVRCARLLLAPLSPTEVLDFVIHAAASNSAMYQMLLDRAAEAIEFRKIFVHGPLGTAKNEDLHALFSQFGKVVSVQVVMDHQTMNCKYAFVVMETIAGAHAALRAPIKSFHGRDVYVKLAHKHDVTGTTHATSNSTSSSSSPAISLQPQPSPSSSTSSTPTPRDTFDRRKIFVRGIPLGTPEETFRKAFAEFGATEWARIALDRDGVQRGFGFVLFVEIAGADAAIAARQIPFESGMLTVFKSEPKTSPVVGRPSMMFGGAGHRFGVMTHPLHGGGGGNGGGGMTNPYAAAAWNNSVQGGGQTNWYYVPSNAYAVTSATAAAATTATSPTLGPVNGNGGGNTLSNSMNSEGGIEQRDGVLQQGGYLVPAGYLQRPGLLPGQTQWYNPYAQYS